MSSFTLRQLRYAVALAEHRHFGRAAAACAVSQPALSMRVRELEEAAGLPLFERVPGDVRATRFGEAFLARARGVLRASAELEELASAFRERLAGPLHLGLIPTVAPYVLPRLITALREAEPEVDLRVHEAVTATLLADLGAGALDAAILALPLDEPGFAAVPLLEEPFLLVREAARAGEAAPAAAALSGERLLLLEEGHCLRDQALAVCGLQGPARGDGLEGGSLGTLVQMAAAGYGVTLVPRMALDVETGRADVSVAALRGPQPTRRLGLAWRRSSPLGEQFARLADTIAGAIRSDG